MKGVFNDFRSSVLILIFSLVAGFLATGSVAIADVTVNVKTDLGPLGCPDGNAVGDGNANDDMAINWAVDYVVAQGGGTVYCPNSVYRVERLFVYEDVNLVGDGKDQTIFYPHPNDTHRCLLDLQGGSMQNFTAYGSFPENSGENWVSWVYGDESYGSSYVIQAQGIENGALIKGVRALEAAKYDALLVKEANNLYVVDCEFDRGPRACVSNTGTPLREDEGFAFINCEFGPLRGKYLFNIEEHGGRAINGGVILNCQFNGTDSGDYGTNVNLWGSFLSLKGYIPPGIPEGPNDRRNVAVVGCDFNDVWIHVNGSFPDTQFSCNRIDGDYPIFARHVGATSILPNAIVQGNYFVGKEYWSQIMSGTSFTGSSVFRCNTSSGANDESCSWPDCNAADMALLQSTTNLEDLAFPELMRLCTNCPREVLEQFYDGYGDWESQAAFSELDDMKREWLVEPVAPNSAGLVGWWELDGDVNDSSGNNNHGSVVGSASYVTGKIDQAIHITNPKDTDDNYVEIGEGESDYDLTDAITVTAWIKMTTQMYERYNKTRNIVAKGESAWNLYMWSESRVKFHCSGLSVGDEYAMGGVDVADRQWHHVAGTYDGSNICVYIDGVKEDCLAATGSISTNDYNVSIGSDLQDPNEAWTDFIDDVRIYDYALSAEEIMYLAGLRNDLSEDGNVDFKDFAVLGNNWLKEQDLWPAYIAHWKFDEGSGTDANDSSGNDNHGSLYGDPCWVSGKIGDYALEFDGDGDYVKADSISADVGIGMTWSVWFKYETDGTFVLDHRENNTGYQPIYIGTSSYSGDIQFYSSNTGNTDYFDTNLQTSTWYHVAMVLKDNTVSCYVDGSFFDSKPDNQYNFGTKDLHIGTRHTISGYFNGTIDDVRIYGRALSEEEVQQLYLEGSD